MPIHRQVQQDAVHGEESSMVPPSGCMVSCTGRRRRLGVVSVDANTPCPRRFTAANLALLGWRKTFAGTTRDVVELL